MVVYVVVDFVAGGHVVGRRIDQLDWENFGLEYVVEYLNAVVVLVEKMAELD